MEFSYTNISKHWESDEMFGWSKSSFVRDGHVVLSEYLLIFTSLMCSSFILQYFMGSIWKSKFLPGTGVSMLLGMIVSAIIRLSGGYSIIQHKIGDDSFNPILLGFSSNVFFFGFLPPIIFNSGYHIKRRLFYDNFGGIISLALLGTCISTIIITIGLKCILKSFHIMECIAFASLLSSTDPVAILIVFTSLKIDPTLFYLVLGESILNDAICITLYNVTTKFITYEMMESDYFTLIIKFTICFTFSTIIGYVFGIFSAFLYKLIHFKNDEIVVVSCFLCTIYIPFLLAEMLQLSGIVALLFTGIASRRYLNKNISYDCKKMASYMSTLISHIAETACFSLLGLSVFSQNMSCIDYRLIGGVILLCWLGRAFAVYPLLSMINLYRYCRPLCRRQTGQCSSQLGTSNQHQQSSLIPMNTMHMVFFSGLRGAVSFACANVFPDVYGHKQTVVATTTALVLFSVFVQGALTETVIDFLRIPTKVDIRKYVEKVSELEHVASLLCTLLAPDPLPVGRPGTSQHSSPSQQCLCNIII